MVQDAKKAFWRGGVIGFGSGVSGVQGFRFGVWALRFGV